jgi:hypothetical protein
VHPWYTITILQCHILYKIEEKKPEALSNLYLLTWPNIGYTLAAEMKGQYQNIKYQFNFQPIPKMLVFVI